MSLETYRSKRNFERTSEPLGRQDQASGQSFPGQSFVVQKHAARQLHYDFRLELDGALLSWAVPKGPSLDPQVKRLAMQTEDHPLEYGNFEGVIPQGEYGGGTVVVWDRGSWHPEGDAGEMYRRGRLKFELKGQKLHGSFHLVRTRAASGKASDKQWLLMKSNDEAAEPGSDAALLEQRPESVLSGRSVEDVAKDPDHVWTSKAVETKSQRRRATPAVDAVASVKARPKAKAAKLPRFIEPELATLVEQPPPGDDWLHEIKLDGYRILARIDGGAVTLLTRRGHDWTARLPTVASALQRVPVESALLDGELVVLGENGVSDFQRLQNSMEAGKDAACVYFVFDVLHLAGFDLTRLPLHERKELLRGQLAQAEGIEQRVRYSDHIRGGGAAFFRQASELGLEGIISKQASSPYSSGRSRAWLKVKCKAREEFVVVGYTEPAGSRSHFGALLVGTREGVRLAYAGKVGTGYSQQSLREISERFAALEQAKPAFDNPPEGAERRGVHWLAPELVAEVEFAERTGDGMIRHASFRGLREDKPASEVHAEHPSKKAPAKKASAKKASAKKAAGKPRVAKAKKAAAVSEIPLDISRIEVTHPERVLYPDQGLTKRDLLLYYAAVARLMLPHVAGRPLMLVRCPEGEGQQCFHQKHPSRGMPKAVQQVAIRERKGVTQNLMIQDAEGLFGLVQMGGLEIHSWGSRASDVEHPDQLVFDLDPDVSLPWGRVVEAAEQVRERLQSVGLTGFVKTTGGKGLHVVVPVAPRAPWDKVKAFTKDFVEAMVQAEPSKYLATMTKQKRANKIFLDYLRNGRGATAVCAFSTRARPSAPVSVPIAWEELHADGMRSDRFDVKNLGERLASLGRDPWDGFDAARAPIPA